MRKTMLFVAACLMSLAASAQVLEVVSMQQLPIAAKADMKVAGVSPEGDYILLTSGSNQGLQRYDMASQSLTTITDAAGAGFNVQVSRDGKEIVYRESSFDRNNMRQNKIVRLNMFNQRHNVVARNQRDMKHMATSDNLTTVSINDRLIVLKRNGLTTTLSCTALVTNVLRITTIDIRYPATITAYIVAQFGTVWRYRRPNVAKVATVWCQSGGQTIAFQYD